MGPKTHGGSKVNLLGRNPKPEMIDLFSNEKQVTDKDAAHVPGPCEGRWGVVPDNSPNGSTRR